MSIGPHQFVRLAADGVVLGRNGVLHSVHLSGGSANATLTLFDNASAASGAVICKLSALIGSNDEWSIPGGVTVANGVFADITGTGAEFSAAVS